MLDYIKLSLSDKTIRKIVKATYPEWKGRKIKLHVIDHYSMANYWDGGSRDYAKAYHLESGFVAEPSYASTNPMRESAHLTINIPEGVVIVEHSIFMGKDVGITIHVNPANVTRLLPEKKKDQV